MADVKAENAGLHEQLKERTKEEQETKIVRMELRDTNTAQKIEIQKLQFERDENKERLEGSTKSSSELMRQPKR